jgi:hypothetical protein
LSMSHPGVTIDGFIPWSKWILSMCHPGGTTGLLSLSSRHKTIKDNLNGMSTHTGIFVASHLVLASKTMLNHCWLLHRQLNYRWQHQSTPVRISQSSIMMDSPAWHQLENKTGNRPDSKNNTWSNITMDDFTELKPAP